MISARQVRKSLYAVVLVTALGFGGLAATPAFSFALNLTAGAMLAGHARTTNGEIVEVRAVARRGGVAVGPRGNAVARTQGFWDYCP
jgi:hypothetical protein